MAAAYGQWWFPTVHIVTLVIGAGILGFPSAMARLGWGLGFLVLATCWIITLHNLWKFLELREHGKLERYADLGRLAWGDRGWYAMSLLQLATLASIHIAYMITGGYGTYSIFPGLGDPILGIVVFAALQIILCLVPSLTALTPVSTISMIMSFGYTAIILGSAIYIHGNIHHRDYAIPKDNRVSKAFTAIGQIGFSYGGGILLALEIQEDMLSTPMRPSTFPMWHGILVSYLIIAASYFPVAGIGYWTFGNLTCYSNVLQLLRPKWTMYAANAMLVIHLTGGYQLRAIPIYNVLEARLPQLPCSSWVSSLIIRSSFVASTAFVAIALPFYSEVLGLVGGLTIVPCTYVMPCIVWMVVLKPQTLSPAWLVNMVWIVFGVLLSVFAVTGSIWSLADGLYSGQQKMFHFPHQQNCTIP